MVIKLDGQGSLLEEDCDVIPMVTPYICNIFYLPTSFFYKLGRHIYKFGNGYLTIAQRINTGGKEDLRAISRFFVFRVQILEAHTEKRCVKHRWYKLSECK